MLEDLEGGSNMSQRMERYQYTLVARDTCDGERVDGRVVDKMRVTISSSVSVRQAASSIIHWSMSF